MDATLWSPVRDVDPRVGEHLLDVLEAAGIAAYLEPAADVAPYTRSVFLPSPPSDRLFVDRTRTAEARGLVDQYADEHPVPPSRPEPRPLRQDLDRDIDRDTDRDIDQDAEWRRIVAAFEAEHGRTVLDEQPSDAAVPPPAEIPILDRPEEHYEPPPPPPLPVPAPAVLYAVLLVLAGVLLIGAPEVIGLSGDAGLVLGVAIVAGGAAVLVSRMRERSVDDGDDGAVV
nr:hypothetical protein [Blastococcus saxobsidens]